MAPEEKSAWLSFQSFTMLSPSDLECKDGRYGGALKTREGNWNNELWDVLFLVWQG